jgi:ubiquinone/menaquinone biosynthesis C-methylase UbiE
MNTLGGVAAIQAYKQETFALLGAQPGSQLLDVGCGPGTDAQALAELVRLTGRVIGVDKSATMIAAAQERVQSIDLPLTYQVGDIYNLEFADNRFDGCRADRVFHHLTEPRAALAELVRVTRSGGRIVLAEPDFDAILIDSPDKAVTRQVIQQRSDLYPNGWCGRQLPGLFKEAGLTDLIVSPKTLIFEDFDFVNQHVLGLRDAAEILQAVGRLSSQQVEEWLAQLAQSSQSGLFFCMCTLMIVSGRKA